MALPPSRRDTIGPPPRNVSDLAAVVRHHGSYLRSLDPGILGGRFATPRPVQHMGAQTVGDSDGGDGGQDIAARNIDRATATVAGKIVLNLTFEPIDGSLLIFWDTDNQPPTEWTLDAAAQLVTFTDPHIHVGDVLTAEYLYYPTDLDLPDAGAWYRLDETSGVTMFDSSGNGHDGLYGGVILGQPSLLTDDPDMAAAWNGFSHSDIPYGPWMDTPEISVILMCKGISPGTLICRDNGNFDHLWVFRIGAPGSGPGGELGLFHDGDGSNQVTTTGVSLDDNLRHMPAFSYDGTTLKLYVDGVLKRSQAVSIRLASPNVPISIGANTGGTGGSRIDTYTGTLDEIRIYPKALSESEFAEIWAAS